MRDNVETIIPEEEGNKQFEYINWISIFTCTFNFKICKTTMILVLVFIYKIVSKSCSLKKSHKRTLCIPFDSFEAG